MCLKYGRSGRPAELKNRRSVSASLAFKLASCAESKPLLFKPNFELKEDGVEEEGRYVWFERNVGAADGLGVGNQVG